MNIYFADRSFNIIGVASTVIGAKWPILNDVYKEDIDSGMASLEFDMRYKHAYDRVTAKYIAKEGNYILYHGIQGDTFFTIIEIESDPVERNIHIYAEDAGLDLINEIAPAFAPPNEAKPITYYTDRFLSDDYQIGINEVASRTRTLSWDGETTMAERLQSLASGFDAEFKFRFEIKGLMVRRKFLDIYAHRGKDVAQQLSLGREIENIVEKRSVANIATALWCTGAAPEVNGEMGDPITLYGYSYDDGDFYVDGYRLKSRTALQNWGRYNARQGLNSDHTTKEFSYDTLSQVTLCNMAIARLKKLREPEITYNVSLNYLPSNLNLGDTVRLVDDKGELYLSARLLKIEISETNDYRNAEFGDYIIKTSGLSDRLLKIASDLREEMANAIKYEWIVYADDSEGHGISLYSTGKSWVGIAANKITPDPDLLHPTLYKWSKIQGEDGAPGTSIISNEIFYKYSTSGTSPDTIRKATEDGRSFITEDDTTIYTLIDSSGNEIIDSDGNSIIADEQNVGLILEGNFDWSTEIPENVPGYYLWTKVVTTYSNGEVYISYSVASSGRGIAYTKTEYYASDSESAPIGGEWSDEIPYFDENKTYFTRVETTFNDGSTTISEPAPDKHLNVTVRTQALAERTDKHFFVNQDGAHVTVGENTPNQGKNLLMTNTGIAVRDGVKNLATFEATGADIGELDKCHVEITPEATNFYGANGTTKSASIVNATLSNVRRENGIYSWSNPDGSVFDDISETSHSKVLDAAPYNIGGGYALLEVRTLVQGAVYDSTTGDSSRAIFYDETVELNSAGSVALSTFPATITYASTGRTVTVTFGDLTSIEIEAPSVNVTAYYYDGAPTSKYAFGVGAAANGQYSFAEGYNTTATGNYSFAGGIGTIANGNIQAVFGRYNAANTSDWFQIGNGSSATSRSNIFRVLSSGVVNTNRGNLLALKDVFGLSENVLGSNVNLNSIVTPGSYYCYAGTIAGTQSNQPFNNSSYQMLVFGYAGQQRFQVAWQNALATTIRYRVRSDGGTWGSWRTIHSAESANPVGTVVYKTGGDSGTVAVPIYDQDNQSGTVKSIANISLVAGHWAVTAHAGFQNGANQNYRGVRIGTNTYNSTYGNVQHPACASGNTQIQTTRYIQLSSTTTIYLNVYSSAAVNAVKNACIIEAIRIS